MYRWLLVPVAFVVVGLTWWTIDRSPEGDAQMVVSGNTAFALDLYGKLRATEGNLFVSPYSVSAALAMTAGGAKGDTAAEMYRGLHQSADPAKVQEGFGALQRRLHGGTGYRLEIANSLWGQKGWPWRSEFLSQSQANYGASLNQADFIDNTEQARQQINAWVEKQTQDRIKDLFAPGVLTPLTRLVLVNAIYFKGDWATHFNKDLTFTGNFHQSSTAKSRVKFMMRTGQYPFYQDNALQVLSMPYKGDARSMVVLLPRSVDGLPELEKSLTPEKLAGWLGHLKPMSLPVTFPKFKMEYSAALKPVLEALGMKLAFDFDRADFSGLYSGPEKLAIQAVVHKAFVEVNEEGTEAAAATGVAVGLRSAAPPPPYQFKADHPFLFLIRDDTTGTILFLGRVTNPQS